ncbi:MAG: hypothetical protein ACLQLC_00190 [Candidatus Sulfotelmatobacter sp.]
MGPFRSSLGKTTGLCRFALVIACILLLDVVAARTAIAQQSETSASAQKSQAPQTQPAEAQSPELQAPASNYDEAIFRDPIPSDQLAFLNHFAGAKSGDVFHDKQFKRLIPSILPRCMFHYGWDIPPVEAFNRVMSNSKTPVEIRAGRYLTLFANQGPYLGGRGFIWLDMKDGIALAGFYFHPTNGEPTPTVTVFSSQVKEDSIRLSQLPSDFVDQLTQWSEATQIAPVTTRYFIGNTNRKILLEHDEDFCTAADGSAEPLGCEQLNADAADIDLTAAYYLDQTNHATNATAWMIDTPDQQAWIQLRDNTCRGLPDFLGCRIRITRQRTRVIINRHSVAQLPHK